MKPLYRIDETEKTLRRRAMYTVGAFKHVQPFDNYTAGYLQALKDMKVEKKYIEIFKNLVKRLRKSYKVGRPISETE